MLTWCRTPAANNLILFQLATQTKKAASSENFSRWLQKASGNLLQEWVGCGGGSYSPPVVLVRPPVSLWSFLKHPEADGDRQRRLPGR